MSSTATLRIVGLVLIGLGSTAACGGESGPAVPEGDASPLPWGIPAGFPEPQIPEDNRPTRAKVELGRHLFYDTRLSGNGTQSCASCHQQSRAFTDGMDRSVGSTGEVHRRNTLSLTNVAYNGTLNWANPILTELESQILGPLFGDDPVELGASGRETEILDRIRSDPDYPDRFAAAFPDVDVDSRISWETVVDALASFCRVLISGDSPFDRYAYGGDRGALSDSAIRGMELFFSERLECHHCHGGFNFTLSTVHDNSPFDAARFHNTGLYDVDGLGGYPTGNTGIHEITGRPSDMGRFRAPTLRNVEVTAPYMHDGSIATLEGVIDHYARGGRNVTEGPWLGDGALNPLKSGFVPGFSITDREREDLIAFLKSLTDRSFLEDPRFSNPFEAGDP